MNKYLHDFNILQRFTRQNFHEEVRRVRKHQRSLKAFIRLNHLTTFWVILFFFFIRIYPMLWKYNFYVLKVIPSFLFLYILIPIILGYMLRFRNIISNKTRKLLSHLNKKFDFHLFSFIKQYKLEEMLVDYLLSFVIFLYGYIIVIWMQFKLKAPIQDFIFLNKDQSLNLGNFLNLCLLSLVLSIAIYAEKWILSWLKFPIILTDIITILRQENAPIIINYSTGEMLRKDSYHFDLERVVINSCVSIKSMNMENIRILENIIKKRRENLVAQIQTVTSFVSSLALISLLAVAFSQTQVQNFLLSINNFIKEFSGATSSEGQVEGILIICLLTIMFIVFRYFWNCLVFLKILEIMEIICTLKSIAVSHEL